MYDDPVVAIKTLFLPLLSVQLLIIVALYLAVVRKRITNEYKFYICFLLCLAFFQIGPTLQSYLAEWALVRDFVLYARVSLLFSLGMPALMLANALQCGMSIPRRYIGLPYVLGAISACLYVFHMDAGQRHSFFPPDVSQYVPFEISPAYAHRVQWLASLGLGTLPCLYFLFKAWAEGCDRQQLYFIFGASVFCVLFSIGSYWLHFYTYYYTGSIVTALCWAWAAFRNLREVKGQAGALIDELQRLVQLDKYRTSPDVDGVLAEIETVSEGNLGLYKLRIREITNRLTEAQILAGGAMPELIAKNKEQALKIEQSTTTHQISTIVKEQIVETSKVISDKPSRIVSAAKTFIQANFQAEIDVELIALRVGVSRSYLMRVFKKVERKTINQYLTELRIDRAKVLLEDMSVTETAFAVGFNNSNYFATVFKKMTGQSPSEYSDSKQLE